MAAAPRDMTTGELEVRLDSFESNFMAVLQEIRNNMLTEAVFEARWASYEQRVTRLEEDHKAWVRESTEAHLRLESDSKARHKETEAVVSALELKLQAEIDRAKSSSRADHKSIQVELKETRKEAESVKRSRINIWLAAAVAIIGSILTKILMPDFGA